MKRGLGFLLGAGVAMVGILGMGGSVYATEAEANTSEALAEALADAEVDSVKLTEDILVSFEEQATSLRTGRFVVGHSVTIDMNGHNLTDNKGTECYSGSGVMYCNMFEVEDGAKLTLTGAGTVTAGRYGVIVDASELVIDGATIDATMSQAYGAYAKSGATVTINNGLVRADYAAFAGNNMTGDMNFYVNGGTLTSLRYPAIYMPGQVYLTMTGGTLNGGIVARLGQIAVSGGTINPQDEEAVRELNDGLEKNYGGMPSMYEAVALVGGTYGSNNAEFANRLNFEMTGGTVNGEIALYDMGREATGYAQEMEVKISGGVIEKFNTKFTEEEIGFALKNGYTAGLNNEAGRVNVEISGGRYAEEPAAEDIAEGEEAEEEEGVWVIYPKMVDYKDSELMAEDRIVSVSFGAEFIADRKAELVADLFGPDDEEYGNYQLAGDGELLGIANIKVVDRNGVEVEVDGTSIVVRIEIDAETYDMLSAYDKIEVVYFEDGVEVERLAGELLSDGEDYYAMSFATTHLSTYGVVGVNEPEAQPAETATTPETGRLTKAEDGAVEKKAKVGVVVSAVALALIGFRMIALGVAGMKRAKNLK